MEYEGKYKQIKDNFLYLKNQESLSILDYYSKKLRIIIYHLLMDLLYTQTKWLKRKELMLLTIQ